MADTDGEGYLCDSAEWTEDVARDFAAREGIVLTDEHWQVLRFMRVYLDEHRIAPDVRHVSKFLTANCGGDRNSVFKLFPFGYVQQACKIAGMRRPRGWSTG